VSLAIFDLDNTLLGGDSDYLWGRFLAERGHVDGDYYERENQRYYDAYKAGTLDIYEFLAFSLQPLARHDPQTLAAWHAEFMAAKIAPIMLPAARGLIHAHQARGDTLLIITATNSFVTRPIAAALEVPHLLATDPEVVGGRYTGRVAGTPCFREGKVERLAAWLAEQGQTLDGAWFYSDSHNDLPLLESVPRPVAVDPDENLRDHARDHGWPVISLRGAAVAVPYLGP